MQIARPRVIAEPGPGGHHIILPGGGQIADFGPAPREIQKIGDHRRDHRLLQHDFRQPHMVGWRQIRPAMPPGQAAAMPVIPVENGCGGKSRAGHGDETCIASRPVQSPVGITSASQWSHPHVCATLRLRPAASTGQPQMTADRRHRMTRLSRLVDGMVAPSVRERGFVISRLVSNWRQIAGDMAAWSRPTQLNLSRRGGGTLKVAITSGYGPIALQMKQPVIDRVNANFGYGAVADIVFVQTLAPQPSRPETPAGDNPAAPAPLAESIWELDARLERVKSPELRAALRRLGWTERD
ncbi:MAG: DUF721 domain-containing protein [Alphaproteobacteria bacterium]|nr:DUF721 domain-containing protein [Alphaproteobacteria bacterium]